MATWNLNGTKHHVFICNGSSCMRKGGEEVTMAIREEITKCGLDSVVHTSRTRCNGRCQDACVVIVYPEGMWYEGVTEKLGREIVKEHLQHGKPIERSISYRMTDVGMQLQNNRPIGKTKAAAK
ncbi:(2Fe-2S) ferredoxin domain-containing protein [Bacillus alveayuensis]|jgi:(2Fe-2S) ferredoxin|uniref:(2Fe-2S) ferredoxin domain-containing protein n=1 Tax=Aeribacillus alveayuensis TaxID=279215 RepID=UPI0005D0EB09|nr:(2Fe-2S) ferredoxin domain-containing protein [Bacillus alveayuensis]